MYVGLDLKHEVSFTYKLHELFCQNVWFKRTLFIFHYQILLIYSLSYVSQKGKKVEAKMAGPGCTQGAKIVNGGWRHSLTYLVLRANCLGRLGFKCFADYANMQLCWALICTVFNCPLIVRFLVNLVLGSEFIYSFNNILLAKIAHFRWITVSQLWKNQA